MALSCPSQPDCSRNFGVSPFVNMISNDLGYQQSAFPCCSLIPCCACPIPCPPCPMQPVCSVTTGTAASITDTTAIIMNNMFSPTCPSVTQVGVEYCFDPSFSCSLQSISAPPSPFAAQLTGLSPSTVYYYRAFADTACGRMYGQTLSFVTQAPSPPATVTTGTPTNVTSFAATIVNNTYANVAGTITEVGVEYSLSPLLTSPLSATSAISTPFSVPLTGLTPSTTYYYRAYIVANGTYYRGNIASFSTLA